MVITIGVGGLMATATVAQAPPAAGAKPRPPLEQARAGFVTQLKAVAEQPKQAVGRPPPQVFRQVEFASPVGNLAAYLTPDPRDKKKHPAIVWITGGDCNTIGTVWDQAKRDNDQNATAYRKAGIVVMFPSLRGGNTNPGRKEAFLGEVDDIAAAAKYLAQIPYVDPERIYLGGHSTGGTLVLLAAEQPNPFRGIFSFGPAHAVLGYDPADLPFDTKNRNEVAVRSPILWLHSVPNPTFVFEGTIDGNLDALQRMARAPHSDRVHFHEIPGANHFSTLAPINEIIARKIVADTPARPQPVGFTDQELAKPFAR